MLRDFIERLPDDLTHAFEFRHDSWFCDETYALLSDARCTLCLYQMAGRETPPVVTSAAVYVRFHGPQPQHGGRYGDEQLRQWAGRIRSWLADGREVWALCYQKTLSVAI